MADQSSGEPASKQIHPSANLDDSAAKRVVLSAKISADAADGLREFCERHGVSATSVLEVGGRLLAEETIPPTLEYREHVVARAREVNRLRRSRRRRRRGKSNV